MYLRQYGYVSDRPLTRTEAAALIRNYKHPAAAKPELINIDDSAHEAYRLRLEAENARRALDTARLSSSGIDECQIELARAVSRRQIFWLDTCREAREMTRASVQILDLHARYGCRFSPPSHAQAQVVLEALDAVMPVWDRDHAELFFQTLELNFPYLVRSA